MQGTALAPVVFIRVNWPWLTFLAAQILLTTIFLMATIIQTANLGVEVMKSSTIATLFAIDNRDGLQHEAVAPGLRRAVDKSVMGELQRREDGWSVAVRNEEVGR